MTAEQVRLAKERMIDLISDNCNIRQSQKLAGVGGSTHYLWVRTDPEYAAKVKEAHAIGSDRLVAEAIRRAVDGVPRKVFYQGIEIDTIREYSDSLLQKLLSTYRPEFKESTKQQLEITSKKDAFDPSKLDPEEWAIFEQLYAKANSRADGAMETPAG